jgi:hypothetical protein
MLQDADFETLEGEWQFGEHRLLMYGVRRS